MGNKLVKQGLKSATRPIKNYNVEERAMKAISQDKPKPAPPYPSMEKLMKEIRNDPKLMEKGKPDAGLQERLQKVYITSQGDNPIIERKIDDSKLPHDRETHDDYEFGYPEPAVIPEGRASLRQIIEFLGKNQNDPDKYTAEDIAKEYKISVENAQKILEHFRPFLLYTPAKEEEHRSTLARVLKP